MKNCISNKNINIIENKKFEGERPLFKSSNTNLINCEFTKGESALKFADNINTFNCKFSSKYLFWHDINIHIQESQFEEGGRASIWYSDGIILEDTKVDAPKIFRDAKNIIIKNCFFYTNETLWDCKDITIKNSKFTGDYLLFHSKNILLDDFFLDGNYSFQHINNMTVKNAIIN